MVKTFLIFRLAGFHVSSIDKIKQLRGKRKKVYYIPNKGGGGDSPIHRSNFLI